MILSGFLLYNKLYGFRTGNEKFCFRREKIIIHDSQQNKLNYYIIVETSLGWVGLLGNNEALKRLILPEKDKKNVLVQLTDLSQSESQFMPGEKQFSVLIEKIKGYFNGKPVHFESQKIDLSRYTSF